jgi:hypothetical protein
VFKLLHQQVSFYLVDSFGYIRFVFVATTTCKSLFSTKGHLKPGDWTLSDDGQRMIEDEIMCIPHAGPTALSLYHFNFQEILRKNNFSNS